MGKSSRMASTRSLSRVFNIAIPLLRRAVSVFAASLFVA
jgi:hypothetical protein